MRLYTDDITTEKIASVLAENDGRAAIISSEGGIFDILSGIYTKNVNIDVILKGYSGDALRVDRIGRNSITVMNPTLTLMLMVQPHNTMLRMTTKPLFQRMYSYWCRKNL